MASNPVPPEPAVRGDVQPAEDAGAATSLSVDVTVEAHREADGGCDSARYVAL